MKNPSVRVTVGACCVVLACGIGSVLADEQVDSATRLTRPSETEAWPPGVVRLSVTGQAAGASETSGEPLDEAGEPLRVSMEFQDANLKDVLKIFSQQTGINVIAGAEIRDQPVTLYLGDVSVLDAMDQILRAVHLTYERPAGSDIYIVKPIPEGPPATITRVYRLKYARVSKSILAKAEASLIAGTPSEAKGGIGNVSGGGGSTGGGGGSTGGDVGIDTVLTGLLTEHGSVVVDSRTNSLVVTDIPENFPRLEAALAALDVRTAQIMVDAEVIETGLSKLKELGVKWGSSEGKLFELTPGSRTSRFPWAEGIFGEHVAPTSSTPFTATTLSAVSAVGVLQALETDANTKVLARPKILTLDNESAIIRLTTDEAIGFQTTTGEQTATTTSQPERTTTGTLLVVTPQVNESGYITMLVEPVVTKTVAAKISAPSGQATPRDPRTRSSRTLVRIRSGDTLVVGGLIDRSEEETVRRVPVLSGIPFLGEAFKHNEVTGSATELMVFVTPRILGETGGQVASAAPTAAGLREQEPVSGWQTMIETTLNELEQPHR